MMNWISDKDTYHVQKLADNLVVIPWLKICSKMEIDVTDSAKQASPFALQNCSALKLIFMLLKTLTRFLC